jgi:hypothetical protein
MGGDRGIRLGEPAGVADFGGHQPVLSCGSDMLRDNVDQMHPVAPSRQPARVHTGAAAHVEHHRRRPGRLTLQQFACAQQLEAVVAEPEQALPFVLPGIAGEQVLTLRHQTILDEP